MKITKKFLKEKGACDEGYEWWFDNCQGLSDEQVLIKTFEKDIHWSNWLIVRLMEYKQYVSYAVFAAEQVLGIYEIKYPNDNRPRNAIKAAIKCLSNNSHDKRFAASAYAAADEAADSAVNAACSAVNAAYSAANAAYSTASAANAAYSAASATSAASAAYSAASAAHAADDFTAADRKKVQKKIFAYGMKLLGYNYED